MDVSANKGVGDDAYVIGVDFGTLSARALVVRVRDGAEAGTAVSEYSRGVIDRSLDGHGELPPDWALQDPADYTRALGEAVPAAVRDAGIDPAQVIGIATDFTASTCMPVLADGTPLCQLPGLAGRPHAYPKLWKHHAAQPHADRINAVAHERGEKWINRYGGKISSEWQFAKALQLLDEDPEMYQRADRWIEAADWIIWQLCGTETRNACTAGYKGIYQDGAYPSREYLAALDPRFASFAAGQARPPGLPAGRPGRRADRGRGRADRPARGDRGGHRQRGRARHRARGRPGRAGQDGGDHGHLDLPRDERRRAGRGARHVRGGRRRHRGRAVGVRGGAERGGRHLRLVHGQRGAGRVRRGGQPGGACRCSSCWTRRPVRCPAGGHGLVALDWEGGNRSVLVDGRLSGAIVGLTLATTTPEIYRALLESTAFGTRMIMDTFRDSGVPVTDLVVAGGLIKSAPLMQIYADVTRRPLSVIGSGQGPALGSAIHAAVAAGAYPDVPAAAAVMGREQRDVYQPDPARADVYDELYAEYVRLHDYFGRGENKAMYRLRAIRDRALSGRTA